MHVPEEDIDIMARTIFGEARGEPLQGQIAVAHVILNRAERPSRFGVGIKAVCLRPKQFSCWNIDDPNFERIQAVTFDNKSFLRAYGVACLCITGDLKDPTDGADHYHTLDIQPYWSDNMSVKAIIGRHRFLKE